MKWPGFVSTRSASLVIASAMSSRQRPWRTKQQAPSVGDVCSAKKTPSGRFSLRFWMPMVVAKKWFARFKPLLRHDQCPCPRPPHRRTAKREASSTQLNWNRFSRIPPPTYSSKAEVVGGKIAVSSWSTVPGSAWLIRPPTKRSGPNPKARNRAVAFRRPEYALASVCKRARCSVIARVITRTPNCPCCVSNGTVFLPAMFFSATKGFAVTTTSGSSSNAGLIR